MTNLPVRDKKINAYLDGGKSLVCKVPHLNGDYLQDSISKAIEMSGGLEKTIHPGDSVILKPNFNCAEPTPLSTSKDFLAAVIEILQDYGVKVTVGEMSGRAAWPTEEVVEQLKIIPMLNRYGVKFINFAHDEWVTLDINSENWKELHVPRTIYESDHRIYLPNMRCHSSARYTGALKLGVGWISPDDREILHSDKTLTESRVGELNLAFQPDFVIMDARRSTIEWAGRGDYVYPNLIMASGDMVAIDTEAVKILKQYPAENRIRIPLEEMKMLTSAQKYGLGSMDYTVKEAPANLATRQRNNLDPAAIAVMNDL